MLTLLRMPRALILILALVGTVCTAGAVEQRPPPDPADAPAADRSSLAMPQQPASTPVRTPAQRVGAYYHKPPLAPRDPIAATDGTLPAKPFDAKALPLFLDAYAARVEAHHAAAAPEGLLPWLAANQQLRRDFWLALSPCFDDAPAAMAVLDTIRRHDPARAVRFAHLAIAFAVVWDSPDALTMSRYHGIWGIDPAQLQPVPALVACWDYFTLKPAAPLAFKPTDLAWPVLVHLVDFDVTPAEAEWAAKACATYRTDIGKSYDDVPYDYDKMAMKGSSKLGAKPYTLANLIVNGGVCGDRAHFTTRMAKAFGIPAMKCCGANRYGSLHAWAGWLVAKGGRPVLEFSGRFDFDFYYTGEVFDPQTRTCVLDRTVAMLYDGLSQSYQKYAESMALARAARQLWSDEAVAGSRAAAVVLARQAVDRNVYNPQAWDVLADAVAAGAVDGKESAKLANRMLSELGAHPDVTLACLGRLMESIPRAQVDQRQKLYEQAAKLYATRPDLQIRLRMTQCDELKAAGREPKALEVAVAAVVANAKEGGLILPLLTQVVETAKLYAATNKSFKVEVVKQQLDKAAKDFPQRRGTEVSASWLDFQRIVDGL